MPIGTIERALLLVHPRTSLTVINNLTYNFASALPSYAEGIGSDKFLPTGSSYAFIASHFTNLFDGAEGATNVSLAVAAMGRMNEVSNLTFTPSSNSSANIVVWGLNVQLHGSHTKPLDAFAYYPVNRYANRSLEQDIVLLPQGQSRFDIVFSHEIMHSVGLIDPTNLTGNDLTVQYTIMALGTHPGEDRAATELQLYDIAALQSIYGRGDDYNAGNTVINSFADSNGKDRIYAIWDGGGIDTIDASGQNKAALIDLRPGYFSSIGPQTDVSLLNGNPRGAPRLLNKGPLNIAIAYGAYIENAVGTSKGDLIIGNLLQAIMGGITAE
jgi:serralysin